MMKKVIILSLLMSFLLPAMNANAVISGTAVQCVADGNFGGSAETINGTDSWSTPTSGNILVIGVSSRANTTITPITWPAGFSTVEEDFSGAGNDANHQSSVQWRESAGTESSMTVTLNAAPTNFTFWACEFDATDLDVSAIDVSVETTTNVSSTTTSLSSGSATNTEANALAIAVLTMRRGNAWDTTSTYSNSYLEQLAAVTSNSVSGVRVVSKVLSTSASTSTTFSTTDSGDPAYAMQLIFSEEATAGGGGACVSTAGTVDAVAGGADGDSREFIPCSANTIPTLSGILSTAITNRDMNYYINGCLDTAASPAWTGTLPAGLSVHSTTGVLSGTPTSANASFAASITCTNTDGFATQSFTYQVSGGDPDLLGSVVIVDSNASPGGDGQTVAGAYDSLNDITGLSNGEDVCLMAGSDFIDQKFELDWAGTSGDYVKFMTCYESSGAVYEWDTGPSASSTTRAKLTSTGDDCSEAWNTTLDIQADYLNINAIHVNGDNHSCTVSSNSTTMVSASPISNVNDIIIENSIIEAWPTATAARDAYKRHRVSGIRVEKTTNVEILNSTIRNGYNGITISSGANSIAIKNSTIADNMHNQISFSGVGGVDTSFWTLIENNDIYGSYDSDGIQFDSSHAVGTANPHTLRDVAIVDNEIYGDAGENGIDLKGAGFILIDRNIIAGDPGNNDGPCDGTLRVRSLACDEVGSTNDNRWGGSAIAHGSGGTEVVAEEILIRRAIMYDNLGCVAMFSHGFKVTRSTMLGCNKDYTGSNSTYSPNDKPAFFGTGNFSSTSTDNVIHNTLFGYSNEANIGMRSSNTTVIDGNMFMTDNSENPTYAYGTPDPFTSTQNLTTYQSVVQGYSTFTDMDASSSGACANCVEGIANLVSDSTDPSGDYDTQAYDFEPQGATAIDNGVADTYVTQATSSGTSFTVRDACVFRGDFGVSGDVYFYAGDYIKVDTGSAVQVDSVNCDTDTITVKTSTSWTVGDPVWLSDAAGVTHNDIGACETSTVSNWCN